VVGVGIVKAVLTFLGALFGFLRDRQLINAGKAEAENEQNKATLEAVEAVRAPITDADRERVWARLQTGRDGKERVPSDSGAGS
jgi:membrane glycosyltransferase